MHRAPTDFAAFEANAAQVAQILRALANERRLMIVCSHQLPSDCCWERWRP